MEPRGRKQAPERAAGAEGWDGAGSFRGSSSSPTQRSSSPHSPMLSVDQAVISCCSQSQASWASELGPQVAEGVGGLVGGRTGLQSITHLA